jgi:hypothetical protein
MANLTDNEYGRSYYESENVNSIAVVVIDERLPRLRTTCSRKSDDVNGSFLSVTFFLVNNEK